MKPLVSVLVVAWGLISAGCDGQRPSGTADDQTAGGGSASFTVIDESLEVLKDEFNEAAGSVRLLFLSGPTCGICLRGLADLDAALLGGNSDPRLRTFVVHVPVLRATASDARNSMVLIDNPHTRHYWEDSGVIGRLYQEAMGIDYYAWDMWFIYGPDARWDGRLPPEPAFWMHQLGPLPEDNYLDSETFAARAQEMLDALPAAEQAPLRLASHDSEAVRIEAVAQPPSVPLGQYLRARGGYRNLAAIRSLHMEGTIETADGVLPLVVSADREGTLTRRIGRGESASVAARQDSGLAPPSSNSDRGLSWRLERELMDAYEITGPLVAWKDKGHRLEDEVNMARLDGVLHWELELTQHDGRPWKIYVDSHTGMERRRVLLDEDGTPKLDIRFSDYRIAEPDTPHPSRFDRRGQRTRRGLFPYPGYAFPYRIEYRREGRVLTTETFHYINVAFDGETPDSDG